MLESIDWFSYITGAASILGLIATLYGLWRGGRWVIGRSRAEQKVSQSTVSQDGSAVSGIINVVGATNTSIVVYPLRSLRYLDASGPGS